MVGKNLQIGIEHAHEVLLAIEALKRGDRIVILWHDACRVTNDPDVRPDYYSTPKETQGTVWDCVPDPEYPATFYLIVAGETTSGKPDYYDSIPIAWIAKLEKLEISSTKRGKKVPKLVAEQYVVNRVLKFAELPQDQASKEATAPRKYVEEVVKVVENGESAKEES